MNKNFLLAASVLIGVMVGAGIFAIPYAVSRSGLIPGFFYFLVLGIAILFIHLFFGEIILRTKEKCRLSGFGQKYLGRSGKILSSVAVILGVTGALLAYLILAGDFLAILFSSFVDLSNFHFSLIFGIILSYFIFRGVKLIAPTELLTNFIFFLVIFIIFFFCFPKINFSNFVLFNQPDLFLPFGVILFSLIGWSAIPEMVEILKTHEEKKNLKKIIISATIVVIIFYVLFTIGVVGISGKNTSSDALSGLMPFLGPKIIFWGALAGLITLADSFLVLGLYLRNTFICDFKISKNSAFLIACGLPIFLFLIGFRSFIGTIGFVGTIVGALEGILIILIFRKVKNLGEKLPEYSLKVPSFLLYLLILIFIFGAIVQIGRGI